jgi:hypothetical protein
MAKNNPAKRQKSDSSAESVFVYTGPGCSVPKDVVCVQFDPRVVEVAEDAFVNCQNLKELILNDGLQKIGDDAFCGCTSLKCIRLPASITEIGDSAFYNCKNLKELILNDGLQKIGEYAFNNCTSLESITLPSSITEIGNDAFFNCKNLSELVLNDGLQKIGLGAFRYCESLESITFPSTITEIGIFAFQDCHSLSEVILHESITAISRNAFFNCRSLEIVKFQSLSSRLSAIAGNWADLNNKVNEVRRVVQWEDGELFVPMAAMEEGNASINQWQNIRTILCRIDRLISYYEMKEATIIFELAWRKASLVNGEGRIVIEVPDPVKVTILEYFYSQNN